VRDGQTSPHRPRLVVSRSTCPPLSPSPLEQLYDRYCSNKHTRSLSRSPSSPPPSFTVTQSPSPPRLLVRDGQTRPHRPRLVVSRSTCPQLSPSPHANSFVIGTATPPWVGSRSPLGWWLGLHQPTWSFGFDSQSRYQPRPGWAPDPLMVGIRSPDGLVVGSCTSQPGVLGSIPKREEPGKTGRHPVLKYRVVCVCVCVCVPHGSQPRPGWAPDPLMVGIRSPDGLVSQPRPGWAPDPLMVDRFGSSSHVQQNGCYRIPRTSMRLCGLLRSAK
jgi:hypothetical protein